VSACTIARVFSRRRPIVPDKITLDAPRACAFAAHGRRNPFPADRCHLRIGTIRCRLIERGS
jgi:hypothetical protein